VSGPTGAHDRDAVQPGGETGDDTGDSGAGGARRDALTGLTLASVPRRAAGRILDTFLVIVLRGLVALAAADRATTEVGGVSQDVWVVPAWSLLAAFVSAVAYEALFLRWRGQTLGMLAVGVLVVPATGGERLGVRAAVARAVLTSGVIVLGVPGLVASLVLQLAAMVDARLRGLHDRAAGTIVVRARPA
jgi:uncharacterized RDD family membrane protein YckC